MAARACAQIVTGLALAVLFYGTASAQRTISLAPHITELIFAAGAGDSLVATVSSSNYPPEAKSLPRVGDGLSIKTEQLIKYKPDIVFAWQNNLALQKRQSALEAAGIKIEVIQPRNISDIYKLVSYIGDMLGSSETSDLVASDLKETITYLKAKYSNKRPVSVFLEIGAKPIYTLGNDPLTNSALEICGAYNVYENSKHIAPIVSAEKIFTKKPDVIIIASASTERIKNRTNFWKSMHLDAAKRNNIYGIHPDLLLRPGPRLIKILPKVCEYIDSYRNESQ